MVVNGHEYRVVWRRDGLPKARKLFGTLGGAERWAQRLRGELPTELDRQAAEDPTGYACCSGWECGCGGVSNERAAALERERYSEVPPLVFGPVVQRRPVGAWS